MTCADYPAEVDVNNVQLELGKLTLVGKIWAGREFKKANNVLRRKNWKEFVFYTSVLHH